MALRSRLPLLLIVSRCDPASVDQRGAAVHYMVGLLVQTLVQRVRSHRVSVHVLHYFVEGLVDVAVGCGAVRGEGW